MVEREAHKNSWQSFVGGEDGAFLQIYQQHYIGLINYGRRLVDDGDFVNDCFIEMLLRFWEKRTTLPPVENVRSYLLTSLRRVIIDKIESDKRRTTKHVESQLQSDHQEWSYEEYLVKLQSDQGLKTRIQNALAKLTPRQLELIRLKFFEDLDYDEISERCNITKRTAYNIIHDAITILKNELGSGEVGSFQLRVTVLLSVIGAASLQA